MAQRHEEETTEFKVETLILCINNCGFTGNPSTKNMCQNCYKASTTVGIIPPLTFSGSSQDTTTTTTITTTTTKARSSSSSVVRLQTERSENLRDLTKTTITKKEEGGSGISSSSTSPEKRRAPEVNRCSGCRRKVGLTGFRCRCGDLFCSEHRYSDRHDCSYDYKAAGRDAIARENPVVKAAKIVRV